MVATPAESGLVLGPGPFTVSNYRALPEEARRWELIDGALLVNASPGRPHQFVAFEIVSALRAAVAPELIAIYEIDVLLDDHTVLIPDIVVAKRTDYFSDAPELPVGAVVLAVEVVSPSSRRMDRFLKPQMYAEAGVPAYWRVELDTTSGVRIATYILRDGAYVEGPSASGNGTLALQTPFPLVVDLASLQVP